MKSFIRAALIYTLQYFLLFAFYVYQAFIVIVWCVQLYYQFAFCVLLFSIMTLALQGYETRKVMVI